MPLPIPHTPHYPDKDSCELPIVQPLPLVNPHDGPLKKTWWWLVKRTEYQVRRDYFTHIPGYGWTYIPKNFVFDFASVPKLLCGFLSPFGVFAYPAVPHDFMYRFGGLLLAEEEHSPFTFQEFSRQQADQIFNRTANKATNFKRLNWLATKILRLWGWINYQPRDIYRVDWSKPVPPS